MYIYIYISATFGIDLPLCVGHVSVGHSSGHQMRIIIRHLDVSALRDVTIFIWLQFQCLMGSRVSQSSTGAGVLG